jgi:hypothetical protein
MVVDRDAIAHGHRSHALSDRCYQAGRLMPEHRRQLRPHVPIGYIGGAHAAREHLADDFAWCWERVFDLLDTHLLE